MCDQCEKLKWQNEQLRAYVRSVVGLLVDQEMMSKRVELLADVGIGMVASPDDDTMPPPEADRKTEPKGLLPQ